MLTIYDRPSRNAFCNGTSRRGFLKIGALGLGGLTLPQLLSADAVAGTGSSQKSVILIYLPGGPPHQDMYDIKMDAPAEMAGPFRPIKTNVPGVEICEHLPRMAAMMDKLVPIRSMVDSAGGHEGYQCFTGRHPRKNVPAGGWPELGATASQFLGPVAPGVPPAVSLCYTTQHKPYNEPGSGFLGLAHQSFRPTGPGQSDMVLQGITTDRLADRENLLGKIDSFRREWDRSGKMDGMDVFTQQAMGILTSSSLLRALDLSKEDPTVIARYGTGDEKRPQGDGAPAVPQNLLVARRLVEAGARVVTVNYGFWDWHGGNFKNAQRQFPVFEQAVCALVEDLHERGMDKDCTVLAWGEFGRTPTINKGEGRDHWPRVSCALMAGGGMRTGQTIGETDRLGGEATVRPVTFQEVFATLYHNLKINLDATRLFDLRGRPHYLLDDGVRPLPELV